MFPTTAGAIDLVAQILAHGVVATLVVEGLVHWVPVAAPATRFALRFIALTAPVVLAVLLAVWLPAREEAWFQDRSLFVSDRWELIRVGGIGARTLAVAIAAPLGLLLLTRDAIHAARGAARAREARLPTGAVPDALRITTTELAGQAGVRPPALDVIAVDGHLLHCRGICRPRILVSTSTLDTLTPEQLRAAMAHEIAHLAHRDIIKGWLILFLRALQCFSPLAQALGRRAVQELEWRADDRAAALTGTPLALAHALVRCARHRRDRFLGLSGQGRLRALEERCRRLMAGAGRTEGFAIFPVVLLSVTLGCLLVLVQ